MPCMSYESDPNQYEIEYSKVLALITELKTNKLPKSFGDGYHKTVRGCTTKTKLDTATADLCSMLQKVNVSDFSLEMQIWWRDHQKADLKRLKEEQLKQQNEALRAAALAKLTPEEKVILKL